MGEMASLLTRYCLKRISAFVLIVVMIADITALHAFASEAVSGTMSETFVTDESTMKKEMDEAEQEFFSEYSFLSLMETDLRFARVLDFVAEQSGIELPEGKPAQDAFGFVDRTAQEVITILSNYGGTTDKLDTELAAWDAAKPVILEHLRDEAPETVSEDESEEDESETDDEIVFVYAYINHPVWDAAAEMFDRMPPEDRMNYLDLAFAVYDAAWKECGQTVADVTGLGKTFEGLGIDTDQISNIANSVVSAWQQIKSDLQTGFDADRRDLYLRMERIRSRANTLLTLLTPICNLLDETG